MDGDLSYFKKFDKVVLTVYMTGKKDPQRGIFQDNNSYEYIKPWYETMKEKQLHGVIFYDKLSNKFIEKYQTDKIFFIKATLGSYSINDERYIIYHNFLNNNSHYKYVLTSDISDVEINKDPFEIMELEPEKLFIGTNVVLKGPEDRTPKWYDRREWKIVRFNDALKRANYDLIGYTKNKYQIYNVGLLGGAYKVVKPFIDEMCRIIFIVKNNKNNNMLIANYIILKHYIDGYNKTTFCTDKLITGYPFNSVYKKYEKLGESEAALIHK